MAENKPIIIEVIEVVSSAGKGKGRLRFIHLKAS